MIEIEDGPANTAVFEGAASERHLAERLTPRGTSLDLLGLSLLALPPGEVALDLRQTRAVLNVMPNGATDIRSMGLNGSATSPSHALERASFDLFAPLDRFEVDCTNLHWELLIQLDATRLSSLSAESFDGTWSFNRLLQGGTDDAVLQLGRLAIDHLRFGTSDRLYAESLAVAMTTRAMSLHHARVRPVPTSGTDARIARAIDYVEAHLGGALSIADLAAVAGMSPSWFRDCFRAATGLPVHAYVRERRLQRARALLFSRHASIQQVAHACGFTDQSHLTRAFKRRFGVTPGEARDG